MKHSGAQTAIRETVRGDRMIISVTHEQCGSDLYEVDDKIFRIEEKLLSMDTPAPKEYTQVESDFLGMIVRRTGDSGSDKQDAVDYRLQWESSDASRDQPRPQLWPTPAMLKPALLRKYRLTQLG